MTHKFQYWAILCMSMLLCTYCSTQEKELSLLLDAPSAEMHDSVQIKFAGNIEIQYEDTSYVNKFLYRPFVFKGKYLYGFIQSNNKTPLICIDIVSQRFIYSLEIKSAPIIKEAPSTFYVHSTDSIFFQTSNMGEIAIVDSLGGLISKIETKKDHKFIFPSFLPYHQSYYDKTTKNFFSTLVPVNFFYSTSEIYDSIQFQGVFNLDSLRWIKYYAPLAGVMAAKTGSFYPPELSVPYNLIVDNKAHINYPVDHSIYVYDLGNGKLLYTKPTSSRKKINLAKPLAAKFVGSRQETWNFPIKNSFYEPLLYHEGVKLFTRALHLPQELTMSDGRLNSGERRQTAVTIFNAQFDIVGDTIFDEGTYQVHGAISLPDGFLLRSKTRNDQFLKFKLTRNE